MKNKPFKPTNPGRGHHLSASFILYGISASVITIMSASYITSLAITAIYYRNGGDSSYAGMEILLLTLISPIINLFVIIFIIIGKSRLPGIKRAFPVGMPSSELVTTKSHMRRLGLASLAVSCSATASIVVAYIAASLTTNRTSGFIFFAIIGLLPGIVALFVGGNVALRRSQTKDASKR